jgi:hypothetical protein
MRSIAGLIVCTLLLGLCAQAQRSHYSSIKGTVIDSTSRQPLEAATVSVFYASDSSLVNYSITNKKGEFFIAEIPQEKPCRLMISYNSLGTYFEDFIIPANTKELTIKTIRLRKSYTEMEEVLVMAQRPPVIIKKDTVEFNAGSFKTQVNGVVEDLLKQLPGVEVDADGNITINGKKVSKITVDGKDFFGSDFKITTKNLPKDIIDKIQIVDNKSREAMFNKTTTGNEDKAINLTLKKDKNKGLFGRINAGYGTDKRYESSANINSFNQTRQLSFIGYANNTNRISSSGDGSIGKPVSSFAGAGSGIAENKAAGINFSNEFNKKLRLTGSYFYNKGYVTNTVQSRRQNIFPDTTFFYNSSSQSANDNDAHRLNLNIDYKPDTLTNLYINGSFNATQTRPVTNNQAESKSVAGALINATSNRFATNADNQDARFELFFGRRLNQQGRSFTLNMNYGYNKLSSLDNNTGESFFYRTDGSQVVDSLNQRSSSSGNNKNIALSASFTEPIATGFNMMLRYNYNNSNGGSDKITDRYNPSTGQFEPDTLYTNSFRNKTLSHTPNLSFIYTNNRVNATLGAGVQWLQQDNVSAEEKNSLKQNYTNLFPAATINYRLSKTSNINLTYNGRSQQPTLQQLQPVPDNSNTLYLTLGNPDLKPSFFHNVNIDVQQYSSKSFFNGGLGFATVKNQIMYETWLDSVQISRPINTNGNYNLSYTLNYSRSWRKKNWTFRFIVGSTGFYNRSVSYTNKIENITNTYTLSQRTALSYTLKDLLTVMPTFIVRFNDTRYSIEQSEAARYMTKTFTLNLFLNWPKRLILENNLQYNYNSRTAPGFPKGVSLWNMAANYQLGKKRLLTVRVAAYDLLKQNTSVNRITTPTYIEDSQVQVLQQYFLVSLIYNLKSLGR